jgi:hypothetical protein
VRLWAKKFRTPANVCGGREAMTKPEAKTKKKT